MAGKTPEQVARAYELSAFLQEHPDAHDQNFWLKPFTETDKLVTAAEALRDCGTTACAAGWANLLAGYSIEYERYVNDPQGFFLGEVPHVAAQLLGLTWAEAYHLFYETGTLAEVKEAIEDIFGPYAGRP